MEPKNRIKNIVNTNRIFPVENSSGLAITPRLAELCRDYLRCPESRLPGLELNIVKEISSLGFPFQENKLSYDRLFLMLDTERMKGITLYNYLRQIAEDGKKNG